MIEIKGKYNTAKVFAETIESSCISQIIDLCNQEWLEGCNIVIMPDCHAGKGCTIGTTIQLKDKVCPSLVGVDLGCGMLVVEIPDCLHLNLSNIDNFINNHIPSGFSVNEDVLYSEDEFDITKLKCYGKLNEIEYLKKSIGSLGGGNHFIEINQDSTGKHYLVIHTGSRNLGKQVAEYYQDIADEHCNHIKKDHQEARQNLILQLKNQGRQKEISEKLMEFDKNYQETSKIPHDLCYLEEQDALNYTHDAFYCTKFASLNRKYIALNIMRFIIKDNGYDENGTVYFDDEIQSHQFSFRYNSPQTRFTTPAFETIHNYIGDYAMLRKGAISAMKDEKVIIPINMRDGSIIGIGKGNPLYNYSGPHGAGRLMSRGAAKEKVNFEEFEKSMEGIYSTSVCQSTLDESPMAYKSIGEILDNISESVELIDIIKPVYNYKAH